MKPNVINREQKIKFPDYSGVRCIMMPYIQGVGSSIPLKYFAYREIVESVFIQKGDIGFLTIDESSVSKGNPHRGHRAKYSRALHTEAGRVLNKELFHWGGGNWGGNHAVTLDKNTRILLANNLNNSCAVWDSWHFNTSIDGDIGYAAERYPLGEAFYMSASDVYEIGIFTPHESLPVQQDTNRQFLRIVGKGVHGREDYFTENELVPY